MDIWDTTKSTQVIQVYLFADLCFLRNPTVQGHQWPSVDQIHCCVGCICLELLGQSSVYLHAPSTLQYCPVHALHHPIMMRIFRNRLHSMDCGLAQNSSNLPSQYSLTHVRLQALKFLTWFIFNLGQPLLKHVEHIRFVLQEVNSDLSTWIISKDHKIQWASERENWNFTLYVGMN